MKNLLHLLGMMSIVIVVIAIIGVALPSSVATAQETTTAVDATNQNQDTDLVSFWYSARLVFVAAAAVTITLAIFFGPAVIRRLNGKHQFGDDAASQEPDLINMLWQILRMVFVILLVLIIIAVLAVEVWPGSVDEARDAADVLDYVLWRLVGWGTSVVVFLTGFLQIIEALKRAVRGGGK